MSDIKTTIHNLANAASCLDKPETIKAFLDIACEGDATLRAAV